MLLIASAGMAMVGGGALAAGIGEPVRFGASVGLAGFVGGHLVGAAARIVRRRRALPAAGAGVVESAACGPVAQTGTGQHAGGGLDLWREERAAWLDTAAAEIAHEIRYPINFFRSVFRRGSTGEHLNEEEIEIGCEEVDRLERLVAGLRRVPKPRLERRPVAVELLATRAQMLLRDRLQHRPTRLEVPSGAAIECDPDQITQVLVNLLSNALDATSEGGDVAIRWTADEKGGTLTVWDSGSGFEVDARQLFVPWYSTKPNGTGLGLSIVHRLVHAHGWTIDVSRDGGRTCFDVAIPPGDLRSAPAAGETGGHS